MVHLREETELGPYEIERFFNPLNNTTESKGKKVQPLSQEWKRKLYN